MRKWIKTLYHKTVEEEKNFIRYQISLMPSALGIMILGKQFDCQYIRYFYAERHAIFKHNFEKLDRMFSMPTVDQIAGAILRNRDVSFREAKRGTGKFSNGGSLLNLIPEDYHQVLMPKLRRDRHRELSEAVNTQVAHAVDEIACALMWMVYFGAGFPYRFPELQLLAFTGPQRNVYVEDSTRRIQLFCDYNKTGSSVPILKTLDTTTSAYLFYFIVVLRQMQINALGKDYGAFRVDTWMDIQNVALRSDVTPQAVSRTALQTYLFLDSSAGDFIKYSMFRKFLFKFPQGDRDNLTFRELRQAMKAVIRYYADVQVSPALPESMASEVMAGHTAKTGLTVYGMDDWSLAHVTGTTATVLQERASERWISWLGLEKMRLGEDGGADGKSNDGDVTVEIFEEDVERTVVENIENNRPVNYSWPVKAKPREFRPREFRDLERPVCCRPESTWPRLSVS
ncbi:hypothetical protein HG537_0F00100 [Torulaspora globosa]|uniref:Uncharacterized protein n=1 Tax=Torulaspora globosa TaxID=48254 RepID=A0A7H9HVG6_9SACH|nr:hypothetical protein HG537_0F00100 [Torulaspora sp. CBS 2947]